LADAGALAALRRRLVRDEAASTRSGPVQGRLKFDLTPLDAAFGGAGLPMGAAHEVAAAAAGEEAAAFGWAAAMLGRALDLRPGLSTLLVQEDGAGRESGEPDGPGLSAWGVDPDRVVATRTRDAAETLKVIDDALKSGAVAAVLAEFRQADPRLDLTATRRFNLAAARSGAMALLVTPAPAETSAAVTRWRVSSAPSLSPSRGLLGPPALRVELTRNRYGRTGAWTLEWDCDERRFRTQNAVGVVRPVLDRPDRPDLAADPAPDRRRQTG